jgi:hypothetical protein
MRFAGVLGLALLVGSASWLSAGPPPQGGEQPPGDEQPADEPSPQVRDAIRFFRSQPGNGQGLPEAFRLLKEAGGGSALFERGEPWEAWHGPDQRASRVVARVNGRVIRESELLAVTYGDRAGAHSREEKQQVLRARLDDMIERELVLQFAGGMARLCGGERYLKKLRHKGGKEFEKQWIGPMMRANHYSDRGPFERFLRQGGVDLATVRRSWVRNFMAAQFLAAFLKPELDRVDDRQVRRYYQKHPNEFRVAAGVTWQDLVVVVAKHPSREAARAFAVGLQKRIDGGEDFVAVSRRYDDGVGSLHERSEGEGRTRGAIRPAEAEAVLFGLQVGQTAVVETEPGFHVVRLLARQEARTKPLAEVRGAIREKLRAELFRRDAGRLLGSLRRLMVVEDELAPAGQGPGGAVSSSR